MFNPGTLWPVKLHIKIMHHSEWICLSHMSLNLGCKLLNFLMREKHQFVVPFIYALTGCFLYVPWQGIKPATSVYQEDALTNWAIRPCGAQAIYRKCLGKAESQNLETLESIRCCSILCGGRKPLQNLSFNGGPMVQLASRVTFGQFCPLCHQRIGINRVNRGCK